MKKALIIISFLLFALGTSFAQTLPAGTCGIKFTYDAAGNRVKREYICSSARMAAPEAIEEKETENVEMIYPNPSSGQVSLYFSKGLQDATISVLDVNGNFIRRFKGSGTKLSIELGNYPDGVYFIKVDKKDEKVIKRIVKVSQ